MKVTIVYGFLGSGKTTFLRGLIPKLTSNERVAVLVNEMGEVGIDGTVLESDEMNVRMLSNGCICCELRGDLLAALLELQRKFHPDRLVIEPTGLASPKQLDQVFRDKEVAKFAAVDSQAAILDASRFEAARKVFGTFFDDQIASSALVLINKVDLVDDATLQRARQFVRDLNPEGKIIGTAYCEIDPMLIFKAAPTPNGHPDADEEPGHDHDREIVDSTAGMEMISLKPVSMERAAIEDFLGQMAAGKFGDVVRAKGFVHAGAGAIRVEYVMGRWDLHDFRLAEPRLEFIGKDLKVAELRTALEGDRA